MPVILVQLLLSQMLYRVKNMLIINWKQSGVWITNASLKENRCFDLTRINENQ